MVAVTANARRGLFIALRNLLTVNARGIFGFLVHANRRVVSLHRLSVAVTLTAERLDLSWGRFTDESFLGIHRALEVFILRISTVTAIA
jgi:hypothetical protein